jgi:hypothetical protein
MMPALWIAQPALAGGYSKAPSLTRAKNRMGGVESQIARA